MLTNLNDMLHNAYEEHYAVGSFNGYSYETFRGIIEAGRKAGNAPIIAAFGAKYLSNMTLKNAYSIIASIAEECPNQQICIHLDHCKDRSVIIQAIRAGFGSVMFDGSALPFGENVERTKEICDIAHACGVSVEAELGSLQAGMNSHEGEVTDREIYTNPEQAKEFVEKTGVDALAVSIGTVHGMYKGVPKVRTDILSEINNEVGIPLVLHGGSGTPEQTIRACIKNGISKINVNTEISMAAVECAAGKIVERPHLSVLSFTVERCVEETVLKYIRFFKEGNNN